MSGNRTVKSADEILQIFLQATDEEEAQARLEELVSRYVEPISRSIIRSKLRDPRQRPDADDIAAEVRLKLLKGLTELKKNPQDKPIRDLRRYVAAVTYHAWDEYLRQKRPQRWRLKNRLRYLLTHRSDFSLWESGRDGWLCGLAAWHGQEEKSDSSERAGELHGLLGTLFEEAGRPIELDRLVNLVADRWNVKDQPAAGEAVAELASATDVNPAGARLNRIEQRLYLERLWAELRELPLRQRTAVLLNLRDSEGASAIELFTLLGIASLRQIARTLDMPVERFAELWNQLPLADANIAARLGITRQQVINLRKAGRERLRRRLKVSDA